MMGQGVKVLCNLGESSRGACKLRGSKNAMVDDTYRMSNDVYKALSELDWKVGRCSALEFPFEKWNNGFNKM
jgi:hypothetical protein